MYSAPSGPPPGRMYAPPTGAPPGRYPQPVGPPPTRDSNGYAGSASHFAPPSGPPGGYMPPPMPSGGWHGEGQGIQLGPPPVSSAYAQSQSHQVAAMQAGQQPQQAFEYSQCTGQRKAVLVGINYIGSENQLSGCINDVHNVSRFLTMFSNNSPVVGTRTGEDLCCRFGYRPEDMVILTDDTDPRGRGYPSQANILQAMSWLVQGAQKDDALFFHYSGHGTQVPTPDGSSGSSGDGLAEAICPVDFATAGVIIDSTIHDFLVKTLPAGCRMTAIFDSCHSGTVMDLPWAYSTKGSVKEPNVYSKGGMGLMQAGIAYETGNSLGAIMGLVNTATTMYKERQAFHSFRDTRTAPADVIAWAGCKNDQTSADAREGGMATGAMSYAFVTVLSRYQSLSYQQLLVELRKQLEQGGYSQKPQLSSSHPMDTSLEFVA